MEFGRFWVHMYAYTWKLIPYCQGKEYSIILFVDKCLTNMNN